MKKKLLFCLCVKNRRAEEIKKNISKQFRCWDRAGFDNKAEGGEGGGGVTQKMKIILNGRKNISLSFFSSYDRRHNFM